MNIRLATPADRERWDEAVKLLPDGTFCHLSGWAALLEAQFGFVSHSLLAETGNRIVGLLPLFLVRRPPFPSALISSPCCVYGGSLATSSDVHDALAQRAVEIGQELRVDYVELRDQHYQRADWVQNDLYATFKKALPETEEDTLLAIPNKQRAEVRKGIRAGHEASVSNHVGEFYPVYAESIHNLGSPGFRQSYYQSLLDCFPGQSEVIVAAVDGRPVASVINFYFKDEVLLYYGGAVADGRQLRSSQFIYWEIMNQGIRRGARVFDFGRSMAGTGTWQFKTHWKFEPQRLYYQYYPVRGKAPEIRPDKKGYALMAQTWQKLPRFVTRTLGPFAARAIV